MSALLTSSNADYHANRSHLSSSNLKKLLQNPELFYQEWVLGNKEPEVEKAHFVEGTLVHTLILEPEKVAQYAIFNGLRKAGTAWEQFKQENPNKICISVAQMLRAEKLYKACQALPVATSMLTNGLPEHTMLGEIMGVPVKVRADYILPGKAVVDLKTTALPSGAEYFSEIVPEYGYDLSAALYMEVANQNYPAGHDWYWVVVSKEDHGCEVYKASEATLAQGRAQMQQALALYKRCLVTGLWVSEHPKPLFDTAAYEILEV